VFKAEFIIITPVFSVTWSFTNQSNLRIWWSTNIYGYYQCWTQFRCVWKLSYILVFRIIWWIESSKEQNLFDQFKALPNNSPNFKWYFDLFICSTNFYTCTSLYLVCNLLNKIILQCVSVSHSAHDVCVTGVCVSGVLHMQFMHDWLKRLTCVSSCGGEDSSTRTLAISDEKVSWHRADVTSLPQKHPQSVLKISFQNQIRFAWCGKNHKSCHTFYGSYLL